MYLEMSAPDMLQAMGDDAMKWAAAFRERFPDVPEDEAFGWFANAIETTWDIRNSAATHSDEALLDHISRLVRNRDLWREIASLPAKLSDGVGAISDEGTLPPEGLND